MGRPCVSPGALCVRLNAPARKQDRAGRERPGKRRGKRPGKRRGTGRAAGTRGLSGISDPGSGRCPIGEVVETMDARIVTFFSALPLQAPGTDDDTRAALKQVEGRLPASPTIVDFGCGTGRSVLALARFLPAARILAIDCAVPFIERLRREIATLGLSARVRAETGDMMRPPALAAGSVDLIWCESAVYFVGLTEALRRWRPLLGSGGHCVISECEWLTDERPERARAFWRANYPRMGHRAENLRRIEEAGYRTLGTHVMSRRGWESYYDLIAEKLDRERAASGPTPLLEGLADECAVYSTSNDSYGYVYYVVKPDDGERI